MNVSNRFLKLQQKLSKKRATKFLLTPSWAHEFLSYKAEDSRPLKIERATELAFDLLAAPNDPERFLIIKFDPATTKLINGQHLLAGFILSGLKKLQIVVSFDNPKAFGHLEISPEAASDLLAIKSKTVNRPVNARKVNAWVQTIKDKGRQFVSFKPTKKPTRYNSETLLEFYRSKALEEPTPAKAREILYAYLADSPQVLKDYLTIVSCFWADPAPKECWHKPQGVYGYMAEFARGLSLKSRRFFSPEQLKELSELSVGQLISLLPPDK